MCSYQLLLNLSPLLVILKLTQRHRFCHVEHFEINCGFAYIRYLIAIWYVHWSSYCWHCVSLLYVIQGLILITLPLDPLSTHEHMVWRFLKGKVIRCTVDDFVLVSHMLGCSQRKASHLIPCTKSAVKAKRVLWGDTWRTLIACVLEKLRTSVLLQLPEIQAQTAYL